MAKYNYIIHQYIVVNMFEEHIFMALQEKIVYSLKNSHQMLRGEFTNTAVRSFPQLTPQQIRALCKAQEQAILQKILIMRPLDIYEQIAAICPQSRDIKTISNEEVDQRIESKLMARREMSEQDQGSNYEYSSRQQFFSEVAMQGMQLIDQEEQIPVSYNSMSHIFELCQNHNIWNPHDILELN